MATEATNGMVPEDTDPMTFDQENLDDSGFGEDVDDIDADEDEDDAVLLDDQMVTNPVSKSCDDDADLEKADDDDDKDTDEDEDEDGDDDLKKQVSKGGLTEASLQKSIARLAQYVEGRDPVARKNALLRRAQLGKSLSKSEQGELMRILGGDTQEAARPARLSKGLTDNRVIQKSVDATQYIAQQHAEMVGALDRMDKSFGSLSRRSMEFDLVLAKAVADIGRSVQRLAKSVAQADAAPARVAKSMGVTGRARPLQKSGMGEPGLSRQQIDAALDGMMQKSLQAGRAGRTESGLQLTKAIAHFDSCGQLRPEFQGEVAKFVRENR